MHTRLKKIRQTLLQEKLDALLVTNPINIYYLTGIISPNPQEREVTLLVTGKTIYIFASPLLAIPSSHLPKSLPQIIRQYSRVGCESLHLTAAEFNQLAPLITTTNLIENIRLIKDKSEIANIQQACQITSLTIKYLRSYIQPGMNEIQIAWEAEKYLRDHKADGLAFPVIIPSGKNSAIPHHTTGNRKIHHRDIVLIDLGAKFKGYCGDMTRTIFIGKPTPEQLKIERIVKQAHQSALRHLGGGRMDSSEVDKACRQVINSAGFGSYFIHSTGHGLGLNIHEPPRLAPTSTDTLKPNMVVTVEPGIYLPNKFGIRHEDTILITANGYKNLTI